MVNETDADKVAYAASYIAKAAGLLQDVVRRVEDRDTKLSLEVHIIDLRSDADKVNRLRFFVKGA